MFLTELAVGSILHRTSGEVIGTVSSIASDTSLTLTANAASNNSGIAYEAQVVPGASDTVTVRGIATVTVDIANAAAMSVSINPNNNNQTGTLKFNSLSLLAVESVTVGGATNNRVGVIDMSLGGTLRLSGGGTPLTLTVNGSFAATNTGTVEYNGSTAQTVATVTYNNLTISNSSSSGATLAAAITTTNLTGNLTLASGGTLDNGGFAIAGNATKILSVQGGAMLKLSGTTSAFPTDFGTVTLASTSTVNYAGSGAQTISNQAYGNLTTSNGGTKSLAATTTVGGSLTIGSGTELNVTAGNFNLSVAGNWSNSGTFTPQSGTVTLNGTSQVIAGSTTFNNLSKTVSVGDTLTFTAGTTQTVAGTTTLQGATSNLLSLRSSSTGTQWNINPQGTRNISFVNVQDSNNTNPTTILPPSSIDSGNNTNWFRPMPVTAKERWS